MPKTWATLLQGRWQSGREGAARVPRSAKILQQSRCLRTSHSTYLRVIEGYGRAVASMLGRVLPSPPRALSKRRLRSSSQHKLVGMAIALMLQEVLTLISAISPRLLFKWPFAGKVTFRRGCPCRQRLQQPQQRRRHATSRC
jgi:hypothetical protein